MSSELGPEARALLARARHSREPSATDRWTVRRNLAVRLAATSAAVTAGVATTKASASLLGGAKVTLMAQFGIATVAGATLATSAMLVPTYVPQVRALWGGPAISTPALARPVRTHLTLRSHLHETTVINEPGNSVNAEPASETGAPAPEPASETGAPAPEPASETGAPAPETTNEAQLPEPDAPVPDSSAGAALHSNGAVSTSNGPARFARSDSANATSKSARVAVAKSGARGTQQSAELPGGATPQPQTRAPRVQLIEEGRALALVQSALSEHRGADALRLLDQQSQAYGSGALAPERAAARVIALCEVGRRVEARSAAERFAQFWPESPLVGRVLETCKSR